MSRILDACRLLPAGTSFGMTDALTCRLGPAASAIIADQRCGAGGGYPTAAAAAAATAAAAAAPAAAAAAAAAAAVAAAAPAPGEWVRFSVR